MQIGPHGRPEFLFVVLTVPSFREDAQPGLSKIADELRFPAFHIVRRASQEDVLGLWRRGRASAYRTDCSHCLQLLSQLVAEIDNPGKIRRLFKIAQPQRTSDAAGIGILRPEFKTPQVAEFRRDGKRVNVAAADDENAAISNAVAGEAEKGITFPAAPLRRDVARRHHGYQGRRPTDRLNDFWGERTIAI